MHKKQGSHKLPQPYKNVCDEKMKEELEKNNAHFDGRKEFIRSVWNHHVMDINELQVNDS